MGEGRPLSWAFDQARTNCDTFLEAAPATQEQFDQASASLQACDSQVGTAALFSPNEDKEDLNTSYLRYLLLPHLLAEVLARTLERNSCKRQAILEQSLQKHTRFMDQCEQYSLLPASTEMQWNKLKDDPMLGQQQDPASKRADKIARFRANKATKAQLEALQAKRRQATQRSYGNADAQAAEEEGMQEDEEREAWILQIQMAALTSLDQLASVHQEIQLLQHAPSEWSERQTGPDHADRRAASDAHVSTAAMVEQLRMAAANLEAPTQRIAASVFRPSHILPTRSLQEQAAIEMDRSIRAQARQDQVNKQQGAQVVDEEESDEQVMRQRAKDEWRDEHPTGWGNSKLRPTA